MPPERPAPDTPQAWLNRAASDLAIARTKIEGVYLEDLCYHAQQCVEKAFKALLLHRQGRFPYVHDLAELAHRIEAGGLPLPETIRDVVGLTQYAVEGRYPGVGEPVHEEEWVEAVEGAARALACCGSAISDSEDRAHPNRRSGSAAESPSDP